MADASAEDTIVIPVPDSGVVAALGLSQAAGLPFELGLIRSHYVGRTFIEPAQSIRHFGVRLKLNPNSAALKGKRVIVVDDSIVRGTTSRKLVGMLRGAGAKEVHVRISSPPTAWPCYYGIDTPTRSELIASSHSTDDSSCSCVAVASLEPFDHCGEVRSVRRASRDETTDSTITRSSSRDSSTSLAALVGRERRPRNRDEYGARRGLSLTRSLGPRALAG